MTKIDSTDFYLNLVRSFDWVREEIKFATNEAVNFSVHSFSTYKGLQRPEITISNGKYGNEKVEVEGFSLADLVTEFIRRVKFANSQANLQLGPPQIDGDLKENSK